MAICDQEGESYELPQEYREVAEGWALAGIPELIGSGGIFTDGDWVESKDQDPNGDVRLIQLADIGDGSYKDKSRRFLTYQKAIELGCTFLEAGDVLVARLPEPLGRACIFPGDSKRAVTAVDICIVRPGPSGPEPRWLLYALNSPSTRRVIDTFERGTTRKRISRSNLAVIKLPIPPLAEQKRIVVKVEELLARVNATGERLAKVPAILRRFRQAVLAAACSGRLTEDWRHIRGVDGVWRSVSLGEVASELNYGSSAKSSPSGSIPVLRMGNIQEGRLDWSDLVFTSDRHEIEKYRLVPGDVLFNRTNSSELVGKTAVYKGEHPAIYAGYLIRVRCSDNLLPDYLNCCLNSPAGRDFCWRVKSDAVSQSNINAKKLAAFELDLPSIEEQKEIVRRVEALFDLGEKIGRRVQRGAQRAEQLVSVILAKAFGGRLVPTEAELASREGRSYEPASALLARIRAEKGLKQGPKVTSPTDS